MHIILLPPPPLPLRGGHDTLQKLKINKTSHREPGKDIADIKDKQQHNNNYIDHDNYRIRIGHHWARAAWRLNSNPSNLPVSLGWGAEDTFYLVLRPIYTRRYSGGISRTCPISAVLFISA